MKKIFLFSLLVMVAVTLTGCFGDDEPKYKGIGQDVEGEITIMLWSGDDQYVEDIGSKDYDPEDLTGQNQATVYAVAKAFKEKYPNVKVNVFAKKDGPHTLVDGEIETSWAQHRKNFEDREGHYPSIWASTDLPGDLSKGLVADLARFEDDPLYQSFNESIMNMMNYYGVQAGLPQYILPWGVFVNKSLAKQNNLDVPDVDWDIEEYTDFVSEADMENYFGAMDTPTSFIMTGSNTMAKQLKEYDGTGPHINIDSDEVDTLLDYVPEWSDYAVYPQNEIEKVPTEIWEDIGGWGYDWFKNNRLLTYAGDPWMMGDAAHPAESHVNKVLAAEWDIYPRPSTDYLPNTLGIVLDPIVVYNYCQEDGNNECSPEEEEKIKIAYTFASFWIGETEAWQARADQLFNDNGNFKTSLNDSLPLVTGDKFDEQMDIWYSTETHKLYSDADQMPGFHEVLRLWEEGQFWDVSDKTYPYWHTEEEERVENLDVWLNMWDADYAGTIRTNPGWLDNVKAKLPDWNTEVNEYFEVSEKEIVDGLKQFYNYTEEDFE